MDGLRDDHRDGQMPYGVDTIRLRISFPAAPVSRGYNGRAWKMRPLRGWTGAAGLDAQRADADGDRAGMMAAGLDRTLMSSGHGPVTPVGQAGGDGEYGSKRWRQALAGVGTEGGQLVKAASELPAGPVPSAAAQAGTLPQPGPGVEEHGRLWWLLHDHGLVHTKHERADRLRKAMGAESGRLVVDGDGVPVNVEQLSDDEVIALGKKLLDMPFELPFIGPAAPVNETAKPGGENPKGAIDESEARFKSKERRIAELLRDEGRYVKARRVAPNQRTADSIVDGRRVEFKTPDPGATNRTIVNEVQRSIRGGGQARDIIVDARGSGLSEAEAKVALDWISGVTRGKLDSVRIVGEGFDMTRRYP